MARRCQAQNCNRVAKMRIRNAFQSKANGKVVCDSASCWGSLTLGYPAEGVAISKK